MRGKAFTGGVLAALLALAPLDARPAEAPELHVYNWSDYIAPDTIANFTKETGIVVTYDVYDGNEVLEAKLLAGDSGYDVVVPSASPFMAREIKAGAFLPLDKAKLPNLKNLDPAMLALAAEADPGNKYGVPYLWSVTGIGYNQTLVAKALGPDTPRDTLALLFDPANAKKLADCGISLLDTPQEVFPAALAYLGRDPKSSDPGDLQKATALLEKIRPYVRKFHSSQYINDLANGDICIALGYSGDVIQARNRADEAKNGVQIAFRVPKEGAQFSIDMMAIPKDAPHPDNAMKFIDYILRPDVIAAISDAVSYPNPNLAATALVKPEVRDDPGIYPPAEVKKLFYVDLPAPRDYDRARMLAWNRVKAGEYVPLLEISEVSKNFGVVAAVDRVSLSVEHSELFALLGPSGCGKTTLLRLIAGFESPDRGRILIDGADVTDVPPYRRPVNMMFQSYALFPHLDVAGNIAFGLKQEGMEWRRREARVAEMLALVQMSDYARRRPNELSGGQKQRVALARALAKMPKLLLLDEPLAALDRKLREETRLELIGIQERVGTSFVFVTHDQEEALGMASRIAVMDKGRVAQIGSAAEIYERPQSRFVADFVGAVNLFDGVLVVAANGLALKVPDIDAPLPLRESAGLREGSEAALAVRPEKLHLSKSQPDGVAIAATVAGIDYQGGASVVHLTAASGHRLKAQMASVEAAAFERGTAVWGGWDPADGVVLAR